MFNSDENYFFSNFNNSKEQLLSLSSIYTLENNNMNNQNENINDIIIKDNYYNNDIRKENKKQFIFDKENENTGYDSKNKNVPPVNLQNLESNSIIINNKKNAHVQFAYHHYNIINKVVMAILTKEKRF